MDLQNIFKLPKTVMGFFGLWPHKNKTYFTRICQIVSILISFTFISSMAAECVYSAKNSTAFLEVLTILTVPLSYLVKQLILSTDESKFLSVYDFLNDKTLKNVPKHLMEGSFGIARTISKVYLTGCVLTLTLLIVAPFITEADLPIRFTIIELGSFQAAMHVFQSCGIIMVVANSVSIDFTIIGAMCIVVGQLDVLKEKIRSFGEAEELNAIGYLRECVMHHNKIDLLVKRVEKAFSTILLIYYLTNIMTICNIGFQLVTVKIFSLRFFVMVFFFISVICQLGMYCWFGNEIIFNSSAIRDACYEADWMNYDTCVRKMLLLIMERSKRPLYLTAGKFSILSLRSFTTVINSAYSFFALMQRTYRKPEYN